MPTEVTTSQSTAASKNTHGRRAVVRSTVLLMAGHGVRVAVQGTLFVLLARELGVAAYGAYAAIAATAAMLMPLVGLGLPLVMVRDVVRSAEATRSAWSELVQMTLLSGVALVTLGSVAVHMLGIAEENVATIAMVLAADTIFLRMNEAVGLLQQAKGRPALLAVLPNIVQGLRLLGLLGMLLAGATITLDRFAVLYLAAAAIPALIAAAATSKSVGGLLWRPQHLPRARLRTGLTFSASTAAATVSNDVDKTILAATVSASTAGLYAAAYRIIDMVYVPVRALVAALYPTLVHAGSDGPRGSLRIAKRVAPLIATYAVLAGAALQFAAAPLSALLGEEYAASTQVIRVLAAVLLLRGVGIVACDALSGADLNARRMCIQVTAAALNIALNLALIPVLGMYGAAIATLTTETVLTVSVWVALVRAARRSPQLTTTQEEDA